MKLTAKQLKDLPDSEFGLVKDGKRSYPLVDKNHVRSAIAFFKYAKPEDRAELAKNINKKAKEFNMKIKAGGLFVRYIDPKVSKYDTSSATYITDASHIGTLAPIVGANTDTASNPKEAEEIINFMEDNELFDKKPTAVKEKYNIGYGTSTPKSNRENSNFDEMINSYVVQYELEELKHYMINPFTGCYKDHELIAGSNTTKKIHEILDSNESDEMSAIKISSIILSNLKRDRVLSCLAIVYFRKPYLVRDIISRVKRYHSIFGEISSSFLTDDKMIYDPIIAKNTNGMNADEIAIFEYFCQYSENINSIMIDIKSNQIRPVNNDRDLFILQTLYTDMKIKGYYVQNGTCFIKLSSNFYYLAFMRVNSVDLVLVCLCKYLSKNRIAESIYSYLTACKKGKDIKPDIIINPLGSLEFTNESSSIDKVVHKSKTFMKGIHMDDEGNVKLNLTDKLSFEHYEEIHKMLKVAYDSENYDEVKRLLAYIFSIIATIEREYMNEGKGTNKKYINKQDPTYKEMVRLRSLYISDFKVYMRKIVTKEPGFKFLEYYNNSSVNSSVYTVNTSDVKKLAVLFRMAMV